MNYVRICEGLNSVGKLIPADEDIWKHIKDPDNKDYYKSIYIYNDNHKTIAEKKVKVVKDGKSYMRDTGVSGIEDVVTHTLAFDFDSENLEEARKETVELCTRLIEKGVDSNNLQICYSGNKGFSVELDTNKTLTPAEFKNIVFGLASDLKTFDPKIHNPSRIFRIPLTKHPVSGLYKLPLSFNQISELPSDVIREMASDISNADDDLYQDWRKVDMPEVIYSMKNAKPVTAPVQKIDHDLDLSQKPRWLTPAKFAIQEGFFVEGERSEALMILGSTYKNQGFNEDVVYRMLKGVAERQANRNETDRFPDEEIYNNIIKTIFSPTWRGGQYAQDHDFLVKVAARMGLNVRDESDDHLVTVDSVSNIFKDFATNIDKNTMQLGIEEVDKEIRVTTSMLVGLLAAPSAGKTSISLNTLNDASNRDIDSVFFSLDMGAPLVYQRLIQKHTGKNSKQIFEEYKNSANEIAKIEQKIKEEYKNVGFCFKSGVTVEDMKDYILKRQDKSGKKTKLVVVDYLECIQGPYSDSTANTALISQKLKDLANELELTLLLLLQPQKHAGDPSSELLSYRNIKGSSAIEQAASVIFTMWRPGFSPKNPQDDRYATIAAVKNRMGGLNTFDFRWNGLTGTLSSLDFEGRQDLKRVREDREKERLAKAEEF